MAATPLDPDLFERLIAAGVDPNRLDDAVAAFAALFRAEGLRATLIDRYSIEAFVAGPPDPIARARLAAEVLALKYPGLELHGEPGGDPVAVVPYEEEWAATFEDWRARLVRAVGSAAVRIDHVGSTSVRGLSAKPVIDILVGVSDCEDESGYVPGMESVGLPLRAREPGHRYHRAPRGRPRIVQVHVCDDGGAWQRDHLLFRDYLRARAEVRDRYAVLKEELAARYRDDRIAYNEGKTAYILDALDAARVWAEQTGWAP